MFLLGLSVVFLVAIQQVELLHRPLALQRKSLHLVDQSSQQLSFLLTDIDDPLSIVIQDIHLFLADAVSAMRFLDALEASLIIPTLGQVFRLEDPELREEGADCLLLHVSEDVVGIRAELYVGFEVIENRQAVYPVMEVLLRVFFELLWICQLP